MKDIELSGYTPGAIGQVTALHATYYHAYWSFDVTFEIQVAKELSEFIGRFRENRDGFWIATLDGRFAGAVAVDGSRAETEGARLRWFIVAPEFQGRGIGKRLLERAVDFSRNRRHKSLYLWTFEGLHRARLLYERQGFELREEHEVEQWGRRITEQKFEISL